MAGLAYAGHDNAALRVHAQLTSRNKIVIQTVLQILNGARLDFQDFGSEREQLVICQRVRQEQPSAVCPRILLRPLLATFYMFCEMT
jgi:hypothetical protein